LALFPNPYSGGDLWLVVDEELPAGSSLFVFSVNGQQVYSSEMSAGEKLIRINDLNLAPGTYFFKLNTTHLFGKLIVM